MEPGRRVRCRPRGNVGRTWSCFIAKLMWSNTLPSTCRSWSGLIARGSVRWPCERGGPPAAAPVCDSLRKKASPRPVKPQGGHSRPRRPLAADAAFAGAIRSWSGEGRVGAIPARFFAADVVEGVEVVQDALQHERLDSLPPL